MLFELWGECKGTGSERKWEYFSWFLAPTLTGNMYSAKLSLATRIKGLCNNYQEGDCEKRTWHEVILGSAPCQQRQVSSDRPPGHLKIMTTPPPPPHLDFHYNEFTSFFPVTFFDGCVWNITSKLHSTKPTISEQSDCASSYESLDWYSESFASLPSISGWVVISTNITQNASY